jgi:amino acid permease
LSHLSRERYLHGIGAGSSSAKLLVNLVSAYACLLRNSDVNGGVHYGLTSANPLRSSSDIERNSNAHCRVSHIKIPSYVLKCCTTNNSNKMSADRHLDDEAQLQALGHKGELQRKFSLISMLGLAFAILNSWTALSSSLGLALPSGGSTSVIWGLVTAGICNLALAASLAEFLSAYPTAGGQ